MLDLAPRGDQYYCDMLTGAQKGLLLSLILDSFTPPAFERLITFRLEKNLYAYASYNADFNDQIFRVIEAAEDEAWVWDFLSALAAERPKKQKLVDFVASFQLNEKNLYRGDDRTPLSKNALEGYVNNDPLLQGYVFITRLAERMRCVCRIESVDDQGRPIFGTGFLVGADLILTNYHVLEAVIKTPALVASVTCRFDYFVNPDNSINNGFDVYLDNNPIIAYSPYCHLDVNGSSAITNEWPDNALDYALVRINKALGNEPFGIGASRTMVTEENKRGWVRGATSAAESLKAGGDIIIIQHPNKEPVKVGIGFGKVNGCDTKQRRVNYEVNTDGGSSGSPGFNKDLEWSVLHNMGDPNWVPTFNQGIPADRIIEDLKLKDVLLS